MVDFGLIHLMELKQIKRASFKPFQFVQECVIQECWFSEHIKIPRTPFRKGGFRGIFTNSRELHPFKLKKGDPP